MKLSSQTKIELSTLNLDQINALCKDLKSCLTESRVCAWKNCNRIFEARLFKQGRQQACCCRSHTTMLAASRVREAENGI